MPIQKTVSHILDEVGATLGRVAPEGLERLVEAVLAADRIYVAGGGRSGLMAKAFAQRYEQFTGKKAERQASEAEVKEAV